MHYIQIDNLFNNFKKLSLKNNFIIRMHRDLEVEVQSIKVQ
jgi:hypothetical protein